MFAALAAATLLAVTPDASRAEDWSMRVSMMRERLVSESPIIKLLGVNPRDFIFRLDYLAGRLAASETSAQVSPATNDLKQEMALELKLDAELLVNLCPVFAAVSGFDESFYNDDPHAPPDPVAFYVPKRDRGGRYALVVVLHGRTQTETDVVSHGSLRALADRDHAILVAPFGTGSELWGKSGASEVFAIVSEMERGFNVDPKRVYLAGIATGGSSALHVASLYPRRFDAVMSIGGGIDPNDAFSAQIGLRMRNVYLIGARDSYDLLARSCVPVSYYATASDRSGLYDSGSQIDQAWEDMFDGVVRNTNSRECTGI